MLNTSLAALGALAYRLQRRTIIHSTRTSSIQNGCQGAKWPPWGSKMTVGVWKDVYPWAFGHFSQFSLSKFFDPCTPSMRKGRDGE